MFKSELFVVSGGVLAGSSISGGAISSGFVCLQRDLSLAGRF